MGLKRKRSSKAKDEPTSADSESGFEEVAASEDELDIFSSLTGAKKKKQKETAKEEQSSQEDGDDDDEVIRESMAKKRAKDGTELLKKMKGKTKMVKGEIGGGSFQSMGMCISKSRVAA